MNVCDKCGQDCDEHGGCLDCLSQQEFTELMIRSQLMSDSLRRGQLEVLDWLTGDVSCFDRELQWCVPDLVHDAWTWCLGMNLKIGGILCAGKL